MGDRDDERGRLLEEHMGRSYYCPHCRRMLNPGTKVIFLVENGNDRELMLLSAKLGEYSVVHSRSMKFEDGKIYTFRCPMCRSDLTSNLDENLVDILTESDDDIMVRVSFSRVFGEQATFLRAPDGVDRYGEHAARYESVNFFGETADQNGD